MALKTARLTLLIDPNKKAAFERLCARQDRTASQVVRQLIREYLAEHGVADLAAAGVSGDHPPPSGSAGTMRQAAAARAASRAAGTPGKKPGGNAPSPATRSGARRG
jgi:hypothetical protein